MPKNAYFDKNRNKYVEKTPRRMLGRLIFPSAKYTDIRGKIMEQTKRRSLHGERTAGVLRDVLCGACIGVAFIIPGFSGGTVAAILGIYERLVGAVADVFKHFARSMKTLVPIGLGLVLGAAILLFPIQWGLAALPLPTVSLFLGLALGGIRPLRRQAGRGSAGRYALFAAAFALAASLALLPAKARPEGFLYALDAGGYLLLFLACFLASCALVVPGISGSMLLLIFGYYTPLVELITGFFSAGDRVAASLAVLFTAGAGILLGFFCISAVMKRLLERHAGETYHAILGFVLGSVIAVCVPVLQAGGPYAGNVWYFLLSALLFAVGAACSRLLLRYAERHAVLP